MIARGTLVRFRDTEDEPWSVPYIYLGYCDGANGPHSGLEYVTPEQYEQSPLFHSGFFRFVELVEE